MILVDHNELSQSIEGASQANILEIIDHHRIGGIITSSPVVFRNERVGCTATIITKLFKENNVAIPADLAGLLCCAIISDTVNFKSVTCTETDVNTAKELARMACLNLDDLAKKILAASANLSNKSAQSIFRNDLKQFEINHLKVTVSQCNIVTKDSINQIKNDMVNTIRDYGKDSGSDIVMIAFSLIDGSGSYVLIEGNGKERLKDLYERYDSEDGVLFLQKVISRKQQLIPLISSILE